jgi:hypothetical protein
MSDAFVGSLIQNGMLFGAFWWLLKALVGERLKAIDDSTARLEAALADMKNGHGENSGKIHTLELGHKGVLGDIKAIKGRLFVVEKRCGVEELIDRRACERGEG